MALKIVLILIGVLANLHLMAASTVIEESGKLTIHPISERSLSWRDNIAQDYGFTFAADYTAFGLTATNTKVSSDDYAASGIFRFKGKWNLIGKESGNTGGIVFKVENRHKYTDTTPKDFAMRSIGMAGLILPSFNDQGNRLTVLYWEQNFNQGLSHLYLGFLDPTDYVDTYALGNPWSGFANTVFSTGAASLGLPSEASLGLAMKHAFSDHVYGIASFSDGNAEPSNPFDGFDTFFNENEYYATAELGWIASDQRFYTDNVHITYWQLDGGTTHSKKDSKGINFSASYLGESNIMPFIRAGVSEGDASILSASFTGGVGYFGLAGENNTLGFGLSWGEVNEEAFGKSFDNQYTAELYYNIAIGQHVNVTPDIQYIKNPALSNEDDSWVFGMRAKFSI